MDVYLFLTQIYNEIEDAVVEQLLDAFVVNGLIQLISRQLGQIINHKLLVFSER